MYQGTHGYEAPEILNSWQRVGPNRTYRGVPADIFSLGVVFFILKFGVPPFKRAKSDDLNFSLFTRKPDLFWKHQPAVKRLREKSPELIDATLIDLLTRMFSADLTVRPKSV